MFRPLLNIVKKSLLLQARYLHEDVERYSIGGPLQHPIEKVWAARYGGNHLVSMIIGGGTGVELMDIVVDVFRHAKAPVDFDRVYVTGNDDLQHVINSLRRYGTGIKSNVEGQDEDYSSNVILRQTMDLHLNIVAVKTYPGLPNMKFKDIDLVVVRQNTEGEYSLLEHENVKGVIETLKIITRRNSNRVATSAFKYAVTHKRKKVTIVTKANIMKLTDGLFLEESLAVSKQYPSIETDSVLVDNCCMQLVKNLSQFDVIVLPNLYGGIISNVIIGLLGGPGLYCGNNYGPEFAVFEPAARSLGADIAGKNVANPTAMLNAAVALLYHLHLDKYAHQIRNAIEKTLVVDKIYTLDLGGTHSSSDFVNKLKENITGAA